MPSVTPCGAAALGTSGSAFPTPTLVERNRQPNPAGKVIKLIGAKGYVLGNADITIALQAPKIGKYVLAMRESLAKATGVNVSRISVKATTTERLGFVGRKRAASMGNRINQKP